MDREREALTVPGRGWHAQPPGEVVRALSSDAVRGLDPAGVAEAARRHGPNRLPEAPPVPAILRLARQFGDPLVLALLVGALISTAIGLSGPETASFLERYGNPMAIFAIVLLNGFLGFFQETRAERALAGLQQLLKPEARVMRAGQFTTVASDALVPGDVLVLAPGDAVAADARLLDSAELAVQEAALTGESVPSDKQADAHLTIEAGLAERCTMVFAGTAVIRGTGRAVVVGTGANTELGKIAGLVSGQERQPTPLEISMERFGRQVLLICIILAMALLAWGRWHRHRPWSELALEAVALAVAAIPEGLPAITTITLALGVQRMARAGAIVRRLASVETLGTATVIATDKTGTLTQNKMFVEQLYVPGERFRVTGEGYEPTGRIVPVDRPADPDAPPDARVKELARTAMLCNDAALEFDKRLHQWVVVGDPTEGALLAFASKLGFERSDLLEEAPIAFSLPFDSQRRYMALVVDTAGGRVAHMKGSIDVLLPWCTAQVESAGAKPLTAEGREVLLKEAERMADAGLRVLAVCRSSGELQHRSQLEKDLTLLGLLGLVDPPRPGVDAAVATCHAAGVRAVMITGDHPHTAQAIARIIGIWKEGNIVMPGAELEKLNTAQLDEVLPRISVFARTSPLQKMEIVEAYRRTGHVVAMTGDGVNDAPALKASHIGVAMGKAGTDVARESSDLVLADDNFTTIVAAIREGRTIYRNIQKSVFFLLSSNAGLVFAVALVSLVPEWPSLSPLMLLWINLVTNGLPALALGMDAIDPMIMKEGPRDVKGNFLSAQDYFGIGFVGVVMGLTALVPYWAAPPSPEGYQFARALSFCILAVAPLVHTLSVSAGRLPSILSHKPLISRPLLVGVGISFALQLLAFSLPPMRFLLGIPPLSPSDWAKVLALSLLVLPPVELAKAVARAFKR